jgi:hypothetical protein
MLTPLDYLRAVHAMLARIRQIQTFPPAVQQILVFTRINLMALVPQVNQNALLVHIQAVPNRLFAQLAPREHTLLMMAARLAYHVNSETNVLPKVQLRQRSAPKARIKVKRVKLTVSHVSVARTPMKMVSLCVKIVHKAPTKTTLLRLPVLLAGSAHTRTA